MSQRNRRRAKTAAKTETPATTTTAPSTPAQTAAAPIHTPAAQQPTRRPRRRLPPVTHTTPGIIGPSGVGTYDYEARTTETTPCRITGQAVEPGVGRVVGGWREHPDAPRTAGEIVRAIIGERVTDERVTDAEAVAACEAAYGMVPLYWRWEGTSAVDVPEAEPWSFLGDEDRQRLADALAEHRRDVQRAARLRRSSTGRGCGWCGVRTSARWTKLGQSWRFADGSRASLCQDCAGAYRWGGLPSKHDPGWRSRLLMLMTGLRKPYLGDGDRLNVRAFIEVERGDYTGTDRPFEYVPRETLHELRVQSWGRHPQDAPDEAKARVFARLLREREAAATRRAVEAEREREAATSGLRW
ncbi:hypothetical protein [Jiangella asiatica]|uniref:Uncharacterized protein n=1 Tax=Jiangella asiatica TaxID=2530372 RepID=A0A4R5DFI9_9ACTN|nr:hypothetical protein [Jiangella asiatica]TDE10661.1 hypothetical protein E1269_11345 [Jiangella asiatica]